MSKIRKGRPSKEFMFKVALDAVRGERSISELTEIHGVHANQITEWKQQLLERGKELFSPKSAVPQGITDKERDRLVASVGMQQIKIDFLKKKLGLTDTEIGGI